MAPRISDILMALVRGGVIVRDEGTSSSPYWSASNWEYRAAGYSTPEAAIMAFYETWGIPNAES